MGPVEQPALKARLNESAPKAQPQRQPGATPQEIMAHGTASAQSAIHFRARFVHDDQMPQSLSNVIVHVIFSTRNREPWLRIDIRPRVHAYLASVCHDLGGELVHVGGVSDHVHIVTTLPRTISQATLVEQVKKTSSKWIKALGTEYRGFFWQRGYGAFSVSPSQLKAVVNYVARQPDHHRKWSFQDEYRELLRKHGVGFDEHYVWD